MRTMLARLFSSRDRMPDEVYAELVDMMFTALVPIVVMGIMTTVLAVLLALEADGLVFALLAAVCFGTMVLRISIILTYRRRRLGPPLSPAGVRRWESRYAFASFAFALALGLLSALTLMRDDVLAHSLVIGLIFGYGAGLATRVAMRPAICTISLVLAVLPTLYGLLTHVVDDGTRAAIVYLAQALLIATFAAAGVETIFHVYRTTLRQLLTQRDLARLARQDALTGLPNRLQLRDQFDLEVLQARRDGRFVALLALDLDRFKAANDRFGHLVGDALLQAVARRMRNVVAEQDTVARIGGDEFVVVQTGITHEDEARILAHRLIRVVSAPYRLGEYQVQIGVSIGVAIAPRDGLELEALASCADAALYTAKAEGRGKAVVWQADAEPGRMPLAL